MLRVALLHDSLLEALRLLTLTSYNYIHDDVIVSQLSVATLAPLRRASARIIKGFVSDSADRVVLLLSKLMLTDSSLIALVDGIISLFHEIDTLSTETSSASDKCPNGATATHSLIVDFDTIKNILRVTLATLDCYIKRCSDNYTISKGNVLNEKLIFLLSTIYRCTSTFWQLHQEHTLIVDISFKIFLLLEGGNRGVGNIDTTKNHTREINSHKNASLLPSSTMITGIDVDIPYLGEYMVKLMDYYNRHTSSDITRALELLSDLSNCHLLLDHIPNNTMDDVVQKMVDRVVFDLSFQKTDAATLCMAFIDRIVRGNVLPHTSISKIILFLCAYVSIDSQTTWNVAVLLLSSANSWSVSLRTLYYLLGDKADDAQLVYPSILSSSICRGAVFFTGMAAWGSFEIIHLKPFRSRCISTLSGTLQLQHFDSSIAMEIALSTQRLVQKHGVDLDVEWPNLLVLLQSLYAKLNLMDEQEDVLQTSSHSNTHSDSAASPHLRFSTGWSNNGNNSIYHRIMHAFNNTLLAIEVLYDTNQFNGFVDDLIQLIDAAYAIVPSKLKLLSLKTKCCSTLAAYDCVYAKNMAGIMYASLDPNAFEDACVRLETLKLLQSFYLRNFSSLETLSYITENVVLPLLYELLCDDDECIRCHSLQLASVTYSTADARSGKGVLFALFQVIYDGRELKEAALDYVYDLLINKLRAGECQLLPSEHLLFVLDSLFLIIHPTQKASSSVVVRSLRCISCFRCNDHDLLYLPAYSSSGSGIGAARSSISIFHSTYQHGTATGYPSTHMASSNADEYMYDSPGDSNRPLVISMQQLVDALSLLLASSNAIGRRVSIRDNNHNSIAGDDTVDMYVLVSTLQLVHSSNLFKYSDLSSLLCNLIHILETVIAEPRPRKDAVTIPSSLLYNTMDVLQHDGDDANGYTDELFAWLHCTGIAGKPSNHSIYVYHIELIIRVIVVISTMHANLKVAAEISMAVFLSALCDSESLHTGHILATYESSSSIVHNKLLCKSSDRALDIGSHDDGISEISGSNNDSVLGSDDYHTRSCYILDAMSHSSSSVAQVIEVNKSPISKYAWVFIINHTRQLYCSKAPTGDAWQLGKSCALIKRCFDELYEAACKHPNDSQLLRILLAALIALKAELELYVSNSSVHDKLVVDCMADCYVLAMTVFDMLCSYNDALAVHYNMSSLLLQQVLLMFGSIYSSDIELYTLRKIEDAFGLLSSSYSVCNISFKRLIRDMYRHSCMGQLKGVDEYINYDCYSEMTVGPCAYRHWWRNESSIIEVRLRDGSDYVCICIRSSCSVSYLSMHTIHCCASNSLAIANSLIRTMYPAAQGIDADITDLYQSISALDSIPYIESHCTTILLHHSNTSNACDAVADDASTDFLDFVMLLGTVHVGNDAQQHLNQFDKSVANGERYLLTMSGNIYMMYRSPYLNSSCNTSAYDDKICIYYMPSSDCYGSIESNSITISDTVYIYVQVTLISKHDKAYRIESKLNRDVGDEMKFLCSLKYGHAQELREIVHSMCSTADTCLQTLNSTADSSSIWMKRLSIIESILHACK